MTKIKATFVHVYEFTYAEIRDGAHLEFTPKTPGDNAWTRQVFPEIHFGSPIPTCKVKLSDQSIAHPHEDLKAYHLAKETTRINGKKLEECITPTDGYPRSEPDYQQGAFIIFSTLTPVEKDKVGNPVAERYQSGQIHCVDGSSWLLCTAKEYCAHEKVSYLRRFYFANPESSFYVLTIDGSQYAIKYWSKDDGLDVSKKIQCKTLYSGNHDEKLCAYEKISRQLINNAVHKR